MHCLFLYKNKQSVILNLFYSSHANNCLVYGKSPKSDVKKGEFSSNKLWFSTNIYISYSRVVSNFSSLISILLKNLKISIILPRFY